MKSSDTQRCIKGQTRVIRMLSELKGFELKKASLILAAVYN